MNVRFSPCKASIVVVEGESSSSAPPLRRRAGGAIRKLKKQPIVGTVFRTVRDEVVRRLLLPRTQQHVYFVVDEAAENVIVHTIWGARRGREPKL